MVVGASQEDDTQASFSNWGPCVDIFSPGVNIWSVAADTTQIDAYTMMSGTSMATPLVAGSELTLLQGFPSGTPAWVQHMLNLTASRALVGTSSRPLTTDHLVYSPSLQYQIVTTSPSQLVITGSNPPTLVFQVGLSLSSGFAGSVTIDLALSDPSRGTLAPSTLTFSGSTASQQVVLTPSYSDSLVVGMGFFVDFALSGTALPGGLDAVWSLEVADTRPPAAGTSLENAIPVISLPFSYTASLLRFSKPLTYGSDYSCSIGGQSYVTESSMTGPGMLFELDLPTYGCYGYASCTLTINTCASTFDTWLAVIKASEATAAICNDDNGLNPPSGCGTYPEGNSLGSQLTTISLDPSAKYYILVQDIQDLGYRGTFTLSVAGNGGPLPPPPPPSPPPPPPRSPPPAAAPPPRPPPPPPPPAPVPSPATGSASQLQLAVTLSVDGSLASNSQFREALQTSICQVLLATSSARGCEITSLLAGSLVAQTSLQFQDQSGATQFNQVLNNQGSSSLFTSSNGWTGTVQGVSVGTPTVVSKGISSVGHLPCPASDSLGRNSPLTTCAGLKRPYPAVRIRQQVCHASREPCVLRRRRRRRMCAGPSRRRWLGRPGVSPPRRYHRHSAHRPLPQPAPGGVGMVA